MSTAEWCVNAIRRAFDEQNPVEYLYQLNPQSKINYKAGDRLIVNGKKFTHNKPNDELSSFMSGVVFDYNGKVLAIPPPNSVMCNIYNFPNNRKLLKNLREHYYTGYPILDGTLVTLYHYNDEWCIATANGYNVGNMSFMNGKTYSEYFNDVVGDLFPGLYDILTPEFSYTFHFKHPGIHLFQDTVQNKHLFLIATSNLSTYKLYFGDAQLDLPETKHFTDIVYKSVGVSEQNIYDFPYGVVLRHFDGDCVQYKPWDNVIIESSLMRQLRVFLYNNHIADTLKNDRTINRVNYICVNGVLTNYDSFIKLFSQYREIVIKIREEIESISSAMCGRSENLTNIKLKILKQSIIKNVGKNNVNYKEVKACISQNMFVDMIYDYIFNSGIKHNWGDSV